MKNVVNRAFMAKKRFLYVTVVLLMSVMTVQANDYMDKQVHLVYCQDHFLRTERKPKEQRPAGGPPQHPTNGPSAGPQKPPSSHR